MRRLHLLIVAACTAVAPALAVDYGMLLKNNSVLSGNAMDKLVLEQNDTASPYLRVPFSGNAYAALEGAYTFRRTGIDLFDVLDDDDPQDESWADISLAKIAAEKTAGDSSISFAAGRFATTDISGIAYNQAADGASLSYARPGLTVSAYGAYTGLLNARTVYMLDETGNYSEDTEKKYELAVKYAVSSLTVSLPNFWRNQTVSVQALGAFRLEDEGFSRMYASLAANGPLGHQCAYALSSTLGITRYDGDTDIANLSKLMLTCYTGWKGLAVGASGVYASGAHGPLKPFRGFTSQTAVRALSGRTEYTGLAEGGLVLSMKPVRTLLAQLSGDLIFDAADTSPAYEGFQWLFSADWQVASDVELKATAYQYFDNDDSSRDKRSVSLLAAISF